MKKTKDVVANQLSDSEIQNIVNCIVSTFKPTHIAISMPLDSDSAFRANGTVPAPRTAEQHLAKWCSVIHAAGAGVLYRGTWCNMENIYSFPYLPSGSGGFIPQGTISSAPTDGNTTWLGKTYQFIINNGRNFQSGDIFAPCPEQTSYVFNGDSFLSTSPSIQTNYGSFFVALPQVCTAAFNSLNISGVITTYTSNNYSEIRSGWMPSTIISNDGIISIDYYGNYSNDNNYTPARYQSDIQTVYNSFNKPVFWQEWGDLVTYGQNYTTRMQYFDSMMRIINNLANSGVMTGFNYWGGWEGQNTSVLYKDGNGNYQPNGRGKILAAYYTGNGLTRMPAISAFEEN